MPHAGCSLPFSGRKDQFWSGIGHRIAGLCKRQHPVRHKFGMEPAACHAAKQIGQDRTRMDTARVPGDALQIGACQRYGRLPRRNTSIRSATRHWARLTGLRSPVRPERLPLRPRCRTAPSGRATRPATALRRSPPSPSHGCGVQHRCRDSALAMLPAQRPIRPHRAQRSAATRQPRAHSHPVAP